MFEAVLTGKLRKSREPIDLANAARDAKQYARAAGLYEKYLRAVPDNAAIHIQCGHMFKEAGDFARAEQHYERAKRLTPDDADLALQLGHFYKLTGRLPEAEEAYRKAIALDPNWPEPAVQLAQLYRLGWRDHTRPFGAPPSDEPVNGAASPVARRLTAAAFAASNGETSWVGVDELFVPELAPQPRASRLHGHIEEITVRWFGHVGRTPWGMRDIIRGVEAIRGFCVSATPIVEVRASLNGLRFYSGPLQEHPLRYEKFDPNLRKYVFNIWYDFSHFREGLYEGQLHFVDADGGLRVFARQLVVASPLHTEAYPDSDRLVAIAPGDERPIEDQVNSLPSVVRAARRSRFPTPPKNVLIIRADQLGDVVVSVPALRRLRELLPAARLVGLLSFANADLARTLDLFDEIIPIDFPDDEWERRRVMPLDKQYELRRRLEPYKFDVAIDLIESTVSRPLLLLTGAPYLFGFRDDYAPWLSASFEGITHDPRNGHQEVAHSARVLALIEWFGTIMRSHAQTVRRDDLTRDRLQAFGLAAADRYAVLHTGARLTFSQWPYYDKLAEMLLARTDLKVVMMTDDPQRRTRLPPELLGSARFQLFDQRLPFDDFDALLSFCAVFVGNDSGPSHVASLRGANVVSTYLARHNWNEWGHENRGYIISRRVPCAGCNVHHDPEECGKEFACIVNIQPEEVFRTVMRCL